MAPKENSIANRPMFFVIMERLNLPDYNFCMAGQEVFNINLDQVHKDLEASFVL